MVVVCEVYLVVCCPQGATWRRDPFTRGHHTTIRTNTVSFTHTTHPHFLPMFSLNKFHRPVTELPTTTLPDVRHTRKTGTYLIFLLCAIQYAALIHSFTSKWTEHEPTPNMLARSTSSRRRRASRSTASSPQRVPLVRNNKSSVAQAAAATTAAALQVDETNRRSRRASAAAGIGTGSVNLLVSNRSPRNSIAVPVGSESNLFSTTSNRNARGGFAAPEDEELLQPEPLSTRSARGSFAEGFSDAFLLPGGPRCGRNSFSVPEIDNPSSFTPGTRSARGSFAVTETSTDLLLPPQGTRSARGSFSCPNSELQISVPGSRSARASFSVPSDNQEGLLINRSSRTPRGSLIPPDVALGPRNSLVPDGTRSPRGSIGQDALSNRSPRGSVVLENINRSPRASITQETNRSPRGSITADYNRSPRSSMGQGSRRGSLGPDGLPLRSPRTSPRGSVPDNSYSPRGSFATASGFQASPRGSVDLALPGSSKGGLGMTTSGSYRLATRNHTNHAESESRRASSSVSQVSADDRRQLCEHTKLNPEPGAGLHVYGSVVYQLKDANMEASGTCDFVFRALRVVFKTVTVTIILVCLSALPIIMLIMGVNYLRDCPEEPHLPVYMVVGGSFGALKMLWIIWRQIKSRRYERLDVITPQPSSNYEETLLTPSAGSRGASYALSVFLIVWFILGNYWTFRIYFPDFEPELYEPNKWCSKALYIFSLVHLGIIYTVIAGILILAMVFMFCHVFSCSLVVRYK